MAASEITYREVGRDDLDGVTALIRACGGEADPAMIQPALSLVSVGPEGPASAAVYFQTQGHGLLLVCAADAETDLSTLMDKALMKLQATGHRRFAIRVLGDAANNPLRSAAFLGRVADEAA